MAPPATSKLYLSDSYRTTFTADVLSCDPFDRGGYRVVLDQTFFYPESGGQLPDHGTIGGVEVVDVQEMENDQVAHVVNHEIAVGPAECRIDWQRRFDNMQHHTGQHVLSRAFITVAQLETVSFHMGDDSCTIDLTGGELTDEVAEQVEVLANATIFENRAVHVRNVAVSDLDSEALRRKLPAGVTEVRLVDVEEFDVCGCCGTHVRSTGELGLIKVLKFEKVKGTYRVSFKVGRRAVADFRDKHNIVKALALKFTTGADSIIAKVDKLQSDGQQQIRANKKLVHRLVEMEAARLINEAETDGNRRCIVRLLEDEDDDYVRALSAALKAIAGTVAVLANKTGTVACNAASDVDIDFEASVVARAKALGGKGGGKGGFANIKLPAGADVAGFLEDVYQAVNRSD